MKRKCTLADRFHLARTKESTMQWRDELGCQDKKIKAKNGPNPEMKLWADRLLKLARLQPEMMKDEMLKRLEEDKDE